MMKIVDIAQYPELRNLFPELTSVEFETSLLFSFTIPQKQISVLRSVNYRLVQRDIAAAKSKSRVSHKTNLGTLIKHGCAQQ
ncbi:transcriptional regulator [Arsenophonus sp. ENCA]|uniref:transcriptional regulator n=1 Tax=Arsenophonus sp. ENCA TaxID=1987579 RepID=UPI0025C69FC6|nr:transcriptional regulator [Arsenophonus sp. ENCA]